MKKAKQAWHIRFWVMLLTAVTGVAGIPGIVLFAIHGQYVWMALCIAFSAHALYGITFYAIAMANAAKDVRLIRAVEAYRLADAEALAAACSMTLAAARECMVRCVKKGYLEGYLLSGDRLERIADLYPQDVPRFCAYCGRRREPGETVCAGCGATEESTEQESNPDV